MIITNETRIAGSLAAKQSKLGAAMHNAAYETMNENIIYIPFTIKDCKNAIVGVKALNFIGATVSMPYKQEIMIYLDKIDPTAQKIGAVNTIQNKDGFLIGYNSDWIGAMTALKEVCTLENKRVALIGAGGAARAIAFGLKENKAIVTIYNRTEEKGITLAKDFNLIYGGTPDKISDYDILINATSVGFMDDNCIVKSVKEGTVVMDVVFNKKETPLLKLAKNCKHVHGYKMLIYQAMFQIELWTGKKPPYDIMEKELLEALR